MRGPVLLLLATFAWILVSALLYAGWAACHAVLMLFGGDPSIALALVAVCVFGAILLAIVVGAIREERQKHQALEPIEWDSGE